MIKSVTITVADWTTAWNRRGNAPVAGLGTPHSARRPGLHRCPAAGRVDRRHLRRVFDRVGVIQIDSVNVLVRQPELPSIARLEPPSEGLDGRRPRPRGVVFEYGGHEASFIP